MAKCIMVQGTASYAGKSLLVAVLCKIFADKGYKVAPFKSQNTSLNSFVTAQGGEIARAQAFQAFAAGIDPEVEMNPILIKPMGESRAQIIVNGKPFKDINARDYYRSFTSKRGLTIIKKALKKIQKKYELIIIEGAGSPAEINLYERDIANMKVAELSNSPVILIADIDRGGVFASIYGTVKLLKKKHRDRMRGIVINKFRGDLKILAPGLNEIEKLTGKLILGVIPFIEGLGLPDEDSVALEEKRLKDSNGGVVVIKLPRISNFTDFDPLMHEGMPIIYAKKVEDIKSPAAIIIPGTKNTIEDLAWMRKKGIDRKIKEYFGKVPIIGICGGYQMLGKSIADPNGIEGSKRIVKGLGLLDVKTTFSRYKKTTMQVRGKIVASNGVFKGLRGKKIYGYEIHMGETSLGRNVKPAFALGKRNEGAVDSSGLVFGTYIHGIFDSPAIRGVLAGKSTSKEPKEIWIEGLERAAKIVSKCVDIDKIEKWVNE